MIQLWFWTTFIAIIGVAGFVSIVVWSGIEGWALIALVTMRMLLRLLKFSFVLALVYLFVVAWCLL